MTVLSELIEAVPYYRYLGLRPGADDDVVVIPGDDRQASQRRFVHGGVLTALIEATGLLHLRATAAPQARTGEITAAFLRPVKLADTNACARIVHRGRRFAVLEITAWQDDPARPVAMGYGTWIIDP